MGAYLPELDDYGDDPRPYALIRDHRHVTRIRRIEGVDGTWPEYPRRHSCQDVTGRWRDHHDYVVESRRGMACLYCGRLRPGRNGSRLRIME